MGQLPPERWMSRFLSAVNMVFNPARPELATVTSETLQAKIRTLLPSQDGFGADLAAQNVIVPIVDLTEAAEGSSVPQNLQTALAFGSQTYHGISNATTTIINTTGFFRATGCSTVEASSSDLVFDFQMSDGAATKVVWQHLVPASGSPDSFSTIQFDLVFFLAAGESLIARSNNTSAVAGFSTRQIADVNGNLVNPSGFTPQ